MTMRLALLVSLAAGALMLPSCGWDGNFTILGYCTRPNYDPNIHSVRVNIFKNKTPFTVTPVPGMEMDLTRAIITAIEQKTPFKVKQDADTELSGSILTLTKNTLNGNQFNYPLEVQVILTAEILWTDLRTGQVLTRGPRHFGEEREPEPRAPLLAVPDPIPRTNRIAPVTPLAPPSLPSDATAGRILAQEPIIEPDPSEEARKKRPTPIKVQATAEYRPSLGESLTSGLNAAYNRLADQIVNAMEVPW
jgi:hypothetical protein